MKKTALTSQTTLVLVFFFLVQMAQAQFRETYFERGFKEVRKGDFNKAVEYLNYSISENEYFQAYFFRGYAKFQLGDLLGSERDLTNCIWKVPTHRDALHYRAIVRSQLSNYKAAFEDFQLAIQYDSTNAEIYLNRAITQLSIENYEEAIEDCNTALELNPKDTKSKTIRAIANTEIENYNEALIDFKAVLLKDPENSLALTHRAACYRQMEEFQLAEEDLAFILLKDSSNVDALLQMALLENDKKNSQEALTYFDRVLELSPYNNVALFNRGITKAMLKDYKGALADYHEVLRTNATNVSVYFNRALVYQKMNNFKAALADFDKVIELLPNFSEAYLARAQLKRSLNDWSGAEQDVQLAQQMEVKNAAMAQKGISDKELQEIMKTLKLASSQQSTQSNKDTTEAQPKYIAIELKPFFHLIPSYYVKELRNHYMEKGELTTELMGLIAADDEVDLVEIQHEIDSLKNIKKTTPLNHSYYIKRGILHTQQEFYNLAFQDFDTAISMNPKAMLAYFGRANVRLKLKELIDEFDDPVPLIQLKNAVQLKDSMVQEDHSYELIIKDYQKAIELNPSFSYAYFNLSYARVKNEQIEASLVALNQSIQLKSDFAEAYYNRGLTYLFLKNNELACLDLSRAGELGIKDAYQIILRYCSN